VQKRGSKCFLADYHDRQSGLSSLSKQEVHLHAPLEAKTQNFSIHAEYRHHVRPSEGTARYAPRLSQGRHAIHQPLHEAYAIPSPKYRHNGRLLTAILYTADRREFIKICQAVGVGFVIMGTIGYFVKLSMRSPLWHYSRAFVSLSRFCDELTS
jgi:preprotein translocase subunit Sss1